MVNKCIGDIGRHGDMGDTGRHRYFKEGLGDIGGLLRLKFCQRKQLCMKFTKGAMQGPLGDIGRHGDLITKYWLQKTNV